MTSKTIIMILVAGISIGAIFALLNSRNAPEYDVDLSQQKQEAPISPNNTLDINTQPPSQTDQQITEEEVDNVEELEEDPEKLALQDIDTIAADPDDPQNPINVEGLPYEELAGYPDEAIDELIERGRPYAEKNSREPRYLFALGRAAYIRGNNELAFELLNKASQIGSPAADAYLGLMIEDENKEEAKKYFQLAIEGGYKPAEEWLSVEEDLETNEEDKQITAKSNSSIDFSPFTFPSLIKSFYDGTSNQFANEPYVPLLYIAGINEELSNLTQSIYYLEEDNEQLLRIVSEIDPSLSNTALIKAQTNEAAIGQMLDGVQDILKDMLEAHKKGPTTEGIAEMNKAILGKGQGQGGGNITTVYELKAASAKDARILFALLKINPEGALRIYHGMKRYVVNEVR